jgi:cytidylate kinase
MLNKDGIRIAISGRSGCGNTTVSSLLSQRLNLKQVNYTFRSVAKEEGVTDQEIFRRAELTDEYDYRVDKRQVVLAREEPSVLGTRLAIWMLDDADLKVYLSGSLENRARRIAEREGGTLIDQMAATTARDERDRKRYLRLYNIDNFDYSPADLVINTDRLDQHQVADIIEAAARTLMK